MNKAFFLDRDGTINVDYNFVHHPEGWTWCKGAVEAMRRIQNHDFKIIVVTNQSGIARGRYTEEDVRNLHRWVDIQLKKHDVTIDGWYYAAHHPEYDPNQAYVPGDRKPGTGMFLKAAQEHHIDFRESFMAGDKISDLQPAVKLGIKPFFIRSRHEPRQDKGWLKKHKIDEFDSLYEVTEQIF